MGNNRGKTGGKPPKGQPFKKGQTGNPNGRPPRTLKVVNEELQARGIKPVTRADINFIYNSLINLTQPEIKKIAMSQTDPIITTIIARAIYNKKGFDVLEKMLDRTLGKPRQELGIDGNIKVEHDVSKLKDYIESIKK